MTAQDAPTGYVYTIRALTDIWTGDADRRPARTIATGLLGSIRWWFEVLVRGLGGRACDPTEPKNRCPDPRKRPTESGHHCVVCELFGCTGWARKFRFEVLDKQGQPKQGQIKKNQTFKFRFTELRPICPQEWVLLDLTLRLIADYGAIGGKTASKFADYGLIIIDNIDPALPAAERQDLQQYINSGWRCVNHDDFAWGSLRNFWFVDRHLDRHAFDRVLRGNQWLAGGQQASKKVFSFEEPNEARRTFGFVNPDSNDFKVNFDDMFGRLRQVWPNLQDSEFQRGLSIFQTLLNATRGGKP